MKKKGEKKKKEGTKGHEAFPPVVSRAAAP